MRKTTGFLVLAALASIECNAEVSFSRQIKPLLQKNCIACHQPQSKQADLQLTSYSDFRKGGRKGAAFVAGKPDDSVVVSYLTGTAKPQMPMGGKPLDSEQIELFRQWIREGAKDDSQAESSAAARGPTVYRSAPMINAFAFSPDGRSMAISGYHEILINTLDGKLAARLPGPAMRIHSLAFTPDGSRLVAAGGAPAQTGEVQIWDVPNRKLLHTLPASNDTLFGASLSPDGKLAAVAGGADKSLRVIEVDTGKEIRRIDHHEDWVFATVFGVDGKRLVSVGRDRAAKLTDVASGRFIENVNLLKDALTAVVRHPKRDWIVIGGAERVPYLYRLDRPRAMRIADDSTLIRKFEKLDGPILALSISPDGSRIAAAAEVGDVRIYDAETGEIVGRASGHTGGIYALQFTPDGAQLATAGFDGSMRFYDLAGKLVRSFVPAPVEVARN